MRFVHASDVHLDSPLRGLERYDGAPVERVRGAGRRALSNLVDLCIDEGASLVVLSGDLYDGNWRDYSTGLFFAAQMSRLHAASIPVISIRGNHDAASQITKGLRLPANVTDLGVDRPETVVLEELGVAVHGQGFATRAVTEDLAAAYPARVDGLFNVGLLHTAMNGRPGHERYAPTSIAVLRGKGYDYWALGHVHTREILSEDPWVVYPGNLQGRHARETGKKGASLVTVEGGRVVSVEHRPLDVVRFEICAVDAADAASAHDVVDLVRAQLERQVAHSGGRLVAARVSVRGASRAHAALIQDREKWIHEIRTAANDLGDTVWVERVELFTDAPFDAAALAEGDDALGQVARSLRALIRDGAPPELFADLAEVTAKLPVELREGDLAVRFEDPAWQTAALRDVERLLLPRLAAANPEEHDP